MADACADSFDSFGFCVIDNVIPTEAVSAIRQEVLEAQKKVKSGTDHYGSIFAPTNLEGQVGSDKKEKEIKS